MLTKVIAWAAGPWGIVVGVVAIIALVVGLGVAIDHNGYTRAKGECDAAAMRAERDSALQDLKAEKDARAVDKLLSAAMVLQKETDDEAISTLEDEVAKRPVGDRCLLTGADAERLR